MGNSGKGLGIVAVIIAIGALGLGVFPIIFPSVSTTPDNGLTLVGLWEDFDVNKDYAPYTDDDDWLLELKINQFLDSNHISLSYSNTRFKLLKAGYYKLTILLILDAISPDSIYWIDLHRNDTFVQCFERVVINDDVYNSYYHVASSLYINSTGLDYFMIRCHASNDPTLSIGLPSHAYNQLSIEYVN